jgi:hypothetical protein
VCSELGAFVKFQQVHPEVKVLLVARDSRKYQRSGSCSIHRVFQSRSYWLLTGMWRSSGLMGFFDGRLMRYYPVSTRINHVANDDEEECSRPLEPVETQNTLF